MSKVATTYWDNPSAVFGTAKTSRNVRVVARSRSKAVKRENASSRLLVFTIIAALSSMICLTVNIRAYTEWRQEVQQYGVLNEEVDRLTNDNVALQEEIRSIKTDESAIETEARKLGMSRPNEKVLVPAF